MMRPYRPPPINPGVGIPGRQPDMQQVRPGGFDMSKLASFMQQFNGGAFNPPFMPTGPVRSDGRMGAPRPNDPTIFPMMPPQAISPMGGLNILNTPRTGGPMPPNPGTFGKTLPQGGLNSYRGAVQPNAPFSLPAQFNSAPRKW